MPRQYNRKAKVVDVFAVETAISPPPAAEPPVIDIPTVEPIRAPEPVLPGPAEPVVPPARPVPDNALSPEQLRIRELEHLLAVERGRKDAPAEVEAAEEPGSEENILIHFVADGHTALDTIWVRGQELEVRRGSALYQDTCDRFGRSWLDRRDDPAAQERAYGEVKFRSGPWPGEPLSAVAGARFEKLHPIGGKDKDLRPTEAELEAAQRAEQRRRRGAPRLPANA